MLSPAIDRYLALRRAVGFALQVDAGLLRDFARFATTRGEHQVTQPTAIAWAAQAVTIGLPVEVAFERATDDLTLPVFRLAR